MLHNTWDRHWGGPHTAVPAPPRGQSALAQAAGAGKIGFWSSKNLPRWKRGLPSLKSVEDRGQRATCGHVGRPGHVAATWSPATSRVPWRVQLAPCPGPSAGQLTCPTGGRVPTARPSPHHQLCEAMGSVQDWGRLTATVGQALRDEAPPGASLSPAHPAGLDSAGRFRA